MNKTIYFVFAFFSFFISCNNSPEDKANALIKEEVKKNLLHADTYEPVETQVDSAFTPFDEPEFYNKTLQICKLVMDMHEYSEEMKDAQLSMSIWGGPYQTYHGNYEYREAKEKYEINEKKKSETEQKILKLRDGLKEKFNKEPKFIGLKARHRFRFKNDDGQITFGEIHFLFDKELTKVITSYDMDSPEYKAVYMLYDEMVNPEAY